MISVIIPTYNRVKVIQRSIESVLDQTYADFELIVVDDGSTDGTEQVIRQYGDSRIRYIRNESDKHGPSAARNIGIKASVGEYIAFNDSDDKWLPEKLEKQYNSIQEEKCDINFCVMQKENDAKDFIPQKKFEQSKCTLSNIIKGSFSGTPAFFGKAECFKNELFDENLNCNEDWELLIRLIGKYNVSFLNEILVKVSVTEQSVSSDYEKAIIAIKYIMEKHRTLYELYPKSRKKLLFVLKYQDVLYKDFILRNRHLENRTIINSINWRIRRLERYILAVCLKFV